MPDVLAAKSKLKMKEFAHGSLLSVENNSCASPRKGIEVKDIWVNIRATMDRSCRACRAVRDVPASETGSHDHK